ncbi:hypothetical protein F4801DRAFT_572678 [Xylaria longipes]|nr:hypothetical protein F4801DRAFT_572678 [Xylaria longipes]RYC60449.1 hypothetical protein CHU98_g5752 [Xylaria longipes]
MASQFLGTTASLSNDSRSCDRGPKTPEPFALSADEQSLPPLRPRLRLKRRHVSQLNAPTQQFLASIAAADVPIQSVEDVDQEMMDTLPELHVEDLDNIDDCHRLTPRIFSPPKTPAIDFAPSVPTKYPDWYSDSTWSDSDSESGHDYESSRPSTAFSTQTSSSLFSLYSHTTDDASCISPDLEAAEFPQKVESENEPLHSGHDKPRKAPWTRAMSSHLWATYLMYLSDPRVTPIRLGKSCIPPHGVCARVARQAQRSWKGSKPQHTNEARSRSSTPTAESTKTYIQWPHTGGATRAHLRELCKIKATNKPGRYISRSPTPFNRAANRRWNRRSTPAQSPSTFSAQDMAMSLVLSTSDTMQPHGPLAQLTCSQLPPISTSEFQPDTTASYESRQPIPTTPVKSQVLEEPFMETDTRPPRHSSGRLGSPFLAKSYGPSSSSSIATKITLPRQSNTVGPRKLLRSPVHLTRSRSGTQKRRSIKGHEEKPWKRPSLAAAFFKEGSRNAEDTIAVPNAEKQTMQSKAEHSTGIDETTQDSTFKVASAALPETESTTSKPFVISAVSSQASSSRPPRLGSPFSAANSSYSFPNRLSASSFSLTALRRPFATVQQSPQPITDTPSSARSSLASRLAYLDQRLKELRNRGTDRRRSQSPL